MRRYRWMAGIVIAVFGLGALTWLTAPVDLIPTWAAAGSSNMDPYTIRVDQGGGVQQFTMVDPVVGTPNGFVRGLAGQRLADVERQVTALGLTTRVLTNDLLWPQPRDAMYGLGRVSVTVLLGRVVTATIG